MWNIQKKRIKLVLGDLLDRFTEHGDLMKHAVFEIIKSNYLVENELKSIQQLQEGLSSIITEAKEAGKIKQSMGYKYYHFYCYEHLFLYTNVAFATTWK